MLPLTANFSDTVTFYDAAGESNTCDVYFRKEADNLWSYHAVTALTGTYLIELGNGMLMFNQAGLLQQMFEEVPLRLPPTANGPGQPLTLDLGHSIADGYNGQDGVTQLPLPSNVSAHYQDGHALTTQWYCQHFGN